MWKASLIVPEGMQGGDLVNVAAGVPLHRQLFLVLHDEIGRGALAAGDALPTEQSLCDQFGVSRITVRRALADLADAGLIERRHGIGSFVTEQFVAAPDRRPVARTWTNCGRSSSRPRSTSSSSASAPCPVRCSRGWPRASTALFVLRLRRERRTGEPLMITEAWLPVELADTVTEEALAQHAALPATGHRGRAPGAPRTRADRRGRRVRARQPCSTRPSVRR